MIINFSPCVMSNGSAGEPCGNAEDGEPGASLDFPKVLPISRVQTAERVRVPGTLADAMVCGGWFFDANSCLCIFKDCTR